MLSLNQIAFGQIYLFPKIQLAIIHFNFKLIFKITPKVGAPLIPLQHKLQVLVSHFFGAKCVTSYAIFLLVYTG